MICPFMSKPIVYSTVESGGDQQWMLYEVVCLKEHCMAWKRNTLPPMNGYCELIDGGH